MSSIKLQKRRIGPTDQVKDPWVRVYADKDGNLQVLDKTGESRGVNRRHKMNWKDGVKGQIYDTRNVLANHPEVQAIITDPSIELSGELTAFPMHVEYTGVTPFDIIKDVLDGHRVLRAVGEQKAELTFDWTSLVTTTANLEGKQFVLDDGVNPAVTFEFDSDDSVTQTATLRKIVYVDSTPVSTLISDAQTAISNAYLDFYSGPPSGALFQLENTHFGALGNTAVTGTATALTGFSGTQFTGGADNDQPSNGLWVVNASGAWTRPADAADWDAITDAIVEMQLDFFPRGPDIKASGSEVTIDAYTGGLLTVGGLEGVTEDLVGLTLQLTNGDNSGSYAVDSVVDEHTVKVATGSGVYPDTSSGLILAAILKNSNVACITTLSGDLLTVTNLVGMDDSDLNKALTVFASDDNDGSYEIVCIVSPTIVKVRAPGATPNDANNGSIVAIVEKTANEKIRFYLHNPRNKAGEVDVDPQHWRVAAIPNFFTCCSGFAAPYCVEMAYTFPVPASGPSVVLGSPIPSGSPVLLTAQANPAHNGMYISDDAGPWRRNPDFDEFAEFSTVLVRNNNSLKVNDVWKLSTDSSKIVIDVDPQYWTSINYESNAGEGPVRVAPKFEDTLQVRSPGLALCCTWYGNAYIMAALPKSTDGDECRAISFRTILSKVKDLSQEFSTVVLFPDEDECIVGQGVSVPVMVVTIVGTGFDLEADGNGGWMIRGTGPVLIAALTDTGIVSEAINALFIIHERNNRLIIANTIPE